MLSFNFAFLHLISKQWNSPGEANLFPRIASPHPGQVAFGNLVATDNSIWKADGNGGARSGDRVEPKNLDVETSLWRWWLSFKDG